VLDRLNIDWTPDVWKLLQRSLLLVVACLCIGQVGCVRRRLTVRTWPPGAQVFVDDQEIGTTPCSTAFIYYGTRKVTVIKGGYKSETLYHEIPPPWYQYPPLDFVTENLVAYELRDERVIDIQLVPEESVQPKQLLDRAQGLRDNARTGYITPLLGAQPTKPQPPLGVPGQGLPGGQPLLYESMPPATTGPSSFGAPPPTTLGQPPAGYAPSGTTMLPLPPVPSLGQ
jgi:hypothetical protein